MADYNPMMETRRPAVQVLITQAQQVDLQAVLWGLEEEGIPVEIEEVKSGKAVVMAKEAAHMSPLNVGIGVDGREGTLALHHRDLPADHPLFVFQLREVSSQELRRLGVNAARLVKSEPLVLKEDQPGPSVTSYRRTEPASVSNELFERIVQSVIGELAKA